MTTGVALPTEDEVRGYLTELSNWNRWGTGADGLRGTLNLITPERVAAAAGLVRTGQVVCCSLPIVYDPAGEGVDEHGHLVPGGTPYALHYMLEYDSLFDTPPGKRMAAMDGFLIQPHGQLITHLDAPAHVALDGTLFNGVPARDALSPDGALIGSVELARDGILGRGVLLDVAASRGVPWLEDTDMIMPADLERCERLHGVRVGPGDCLVVRTGYRARRPQGAPKVAGYARPGLQAACLPWLRERDVALVSSDVPTDCWPYLYESLGLPVHTVGLWSIGLWLVDNCYLEVLSAQCAGSGRYEFFFTVAPLLLTHGTGSPVTPLAVF
jgi:kynurenine formamidase